MILKQFRILLFCSLAISAATLLFPQDTPTREVKSLNGLWMFQVESQSGEGIHNKWYQKRLSLIGKTIVMAVPSSYNDIVVDERIRDYVGIVWYERTFFVPKNWRNGRVRVYFTSVNYFAQVWINGKFATAHEFGGLPFQGDITNLVNYGEENIITLAVNNTLTEDTLPTGSLREVKTANDTILVQTVPFRYFHYAGIDGRVFIESTPTFYVKDITLTTQIDGSNGLVNITIKCGGMSLDDGEVNYTISIQNDERKCVAARTTISQDDQFSDSMIVNNASLWWPIFTNTNHGYLYRFKVTICATNSKNLKIEDIYTIQFGIRSIQITARQLLINNKPIYLRGIGSLQDSDLRGRGEDIVAVARDLQIAQWVGINIYRMAYYPHEELVLDVADPGGILIINECSYITDHFNPNLLEKHKRMLKEIIERDKNRPSVFMWSIANNPTLAGAQDDSYFRSLVSYVKSLDAFRLVTALMQPLAVYENKQLPILTDLDIVSVQSYYGWHSYGGILGTIPLQVIQEIQAWQAKAGKPILMLEYGASSYSGVHKLPEFPWSEEYQIAFLSQYFRAFDQLRAQNQSQLVGEVVWAFTDSQTKASASSEVDGDKKGLFTRQRQPKCSAKFVRKRYFYLANKLDGEPLPDNLDTYVAT